MVSFAGIVTKSKIKVTYYQCETLKLRYGDKCMVEGDNGPAFGEVVTGSQTYGEMLCKRPLKRVLRLATKEDIEQHQNICKLEEDAFKLCLDKIRLRELPMKLISVDFAFDGAKAIFYFNAEGRVDFRELVRDLAHALKTRVELKQIGVRDKARLCGGIGPCGRSLCCATFLKSFQPISIKMAKGQNLSLNPLKISGICGRLMCCLNYEHGSAETGCGAAEPQVMDESDEQL